MATLFQRQNKEGAGGEALMVDMTVFVLMRSNNQHFPTIFANHLWFISLGRRGFFQ